MQGKGQQPEYCIAKFTMLFDSFCDFFLIFSVDTFVGDVLL